VPGALGVEVDVSAVGGIFWSVIEAGGGSEAGFFAAGDGKGIDVEVVNSVLQALAGEGDGFAVGRPAVPVRRAVRGDLAGSAAGDGNDVDAGFVIVWRCVADGERLAVGRDAVVVVAVRLRRGGNERRFAAIKSEPVERSILIEDEELAVSGPVGRLKVRGGGVFDVAVGGSDADGFERADESCGSGRG
jgi:hypothetical protein